VDPKLADRLSGPYHLLVQLVSTRLFSSNLGHDTAFAEICYSVLHFLQTNLRVPRITLN